MDVHIHIHRHIHIHIHICITLFKYVYISGYLYIRITLYIYIYYIHTYIHTHVYIYICVCVCAHTCLPIYLSIYLLILILYISKELIAWVLPQLPRYSAFSTWTFSSALSITGWLSSSPFPHGKADPFAAPGHAPFSVDEVLFCFLSGNFRWRRLSILWLVR